MIGESTGDGQPTRPRVMVTRATGQAAGLVSALRDAGLDPVPVPTIAVEFAPPGGDLHAAVARLHAYAWVVLTSANGVAAVLDAAGRTSPRLGRPSWAVVGAATRRILEREGISVDFQPGQSSGAAMAAGLPVVPGDRILVIRGDLAGAGLAAALRDRGAEVDDVVAYRTREAPSASRPLLREALAGGPISAVVFTSGSTVRGLVALGRSASIDIRSIPSVCIGPATADEARAAGFHVVATSPTPAATAIAAITARAFVLEPQEIR